MADLKDHVSELIRQLQRVTDERNRYEVALRAHEASLRAQEAAAGASAQQQMARHSTERCDKQCERYEERIVELHSVIAELSRKLQARIVTDHLI